MLSLIAVACAADFRVKFEVSTTKGEKEFTVLVHEDWAPIGAARFKELVEEKFYDDTRFFRVLPTFMVQFGLNGNPDVSSTCVGRRLCSEPGRARQRWRARGSAGGRRVWEEAALTSTTAAAWAAGSCGPAGSTEAAGEAGDELARSPAP